MAKQDVLEKVHKLIKLSQSDNDEEARTAAVQATRLMAEHKLVLVPQSELERVNTAMKDIQGQLSSQKSDSTQKMLLGAFAGWMAAKNGLL